MPLPLSAAGVWNELGNWYLYKDQKYWHKDIELIADGRRKGIVHNTHQLAGAELEAFVRRCLDTEDYRVLGVPLEDHDYEYLQKLKACEKP